MKKSDEDKRVADLQKEGPYFVVGTHGSVRSVQPGSGLMKGERLVQVLHAPGDRVTRQRAAALVAAAARWNKLSDGEREAMLAEDGETYVNLRRAALRVREVDLG